MHRKLVVDHVRDVFCSLYKSKAQPGTAIICNFIPYTWMKYSIPIRINPEISEKTARKYLGKLGFDKQSIDSYAKFLDENKALGKIYFAAKDKKRAMADALDTVWFGYLNNLRGEKLHAIIGTSKINELSENIMAKITLELKTGEKDATDDEVASIRNRLRELKKRDPEFPLNYSNIGMIQAHRSIPPEVMRRLFNR